MFAIFYSICRFLLPFGLIYGATLIHNLILIFRLGLPINKPKTVDNCSLFNGRIILKVPLDLGKVLRLVEHNSIKSGIEIKLTHLTIKAVAVALYDYLPHMKGYVINNEFYHSDSPYNCNNNNKNDFEKCDIVVSVGSDIVECETVMIKLNNINSKSIDTIAQELQSTTKLLLSNSISSHKHKTKKEIFLSYFPVIIRAHLKYLLYFITDGLGFNIKFLGMFIAYMSQFILIHKKL